MDIFDQLGFDIVPNQVWSFTDFGNNIDSALEQFFARIGFDPERIKNRNERSISQANDILNLLVEVETAFLHLNDDLRAEISGRLQSGHYETVRQAARSVAVFERINRAGNQWSQEKRLGIFNELLRDA